MQSNRIDAAFTVEQNEKSKAALATLAAPLPFLIDLNAEGPAAIAKFSETKRSKNV
ncbi:MAG: hypothetical protein WCK49_08515 [Myxococcaceae bacterium]